MVARKLQPEDNRSTAKVLKIRIERKPLKMFPTIERKPLLKNVSYQVSFGGREGVGDFTSRVVESFSDLSLGPLGLSDSRAMHKVNNLLRL